FSEDFIPQFAKTYRGEVFTKFVFDDTERTFLEENLFYQGTPERYMTIACLNIVCSQCVRHASMDKRGNEELSGRIIEYVLAHITEEMSMKSVAEDFGYEYHYFSAIFNKCIGMSFKDFLNLCRVERACELLNDASATLTHVALESGFQSIRNFDRVFKKVNGITPKEYMRMSQEKM
ncbi:MAG: helix-turn-helix transcriptional regulator, partial [Clostridia bacterium]|nr:helix-turn-helix transcriptional regulator [Clostridia bacterium]